MNRAIRDIDEKAGEVALTESRSGDACAPPDRRRRRNAGRLKLLRTAERLFGDHGLDGVSMRQIILAAGLANNSAIAHHFGSKEELLYAIVDLRADELEAAHRRRLIMLDQGGDESVRGLLGVLLLPFAEDIESDGEPTFVRFLSRLLHMPPAEHPMYSRGRSMSTASEIDARLRSKLSFLPTALFWVRYRLVIGLFFSGVIERARIVDEAMGYGGEAQIITDDLLTVTAAALQAPIRSGVNRP